MAKLSKLFIVFGLLNLIVGCASTKQKETLVVFNWGEYIAPNVISDFEDKYNCKVIYETFDSNEMMYTKLMGGNQYDVMVPSDYMIERLIKEGQLQKIDTTKITNKNHFDDAILHPEFDPQGAYWVPCFYGNVGIVYDKTIVKKKDLQQGWNILRNKRYKNRIYMYDSERDSFMIALKALGYSMNSTKPKEVEEAYQWLVKQKQEMRPIYVGDEAIDAMKNGEKAMAVMYSGDATAVLEENEDMDFFMPEEGTNYWFDGFVIAKESKKTELASVFINYMVSDTVTLRNTQEVGYLTANTKSASDAARKDFKDNNAYRIRMHKNDEIFRYQNDKIRSLFTDRWTRIINK